MPEMSFRENYRLGIEQFFTSRTYYVNDLDVWSTFSETIHV